MPRDTSTDAIAQSLMTAYVNVLSGLVGWGVTNNPVGVAVYPHLDLPAPQEPFPGCWLYIAGTQHDFTQGTGYRVDTYTVMARIIGGPITPNYRYNPEDKVYTMLNAVVNELSWRRHLQDPTNVTTNDPDGVPFQYIDPLGKLVVGANGPIRGFNYGDLGVFAGIEIPTTVSLDIHVGRLS